MNLLRTIIDHRPATLARRGLAPLELVISLPLLLAVMALIVNFSHAATWKIRAATNARLAMWRHRPMWDADGDPKPVNFWPAGASLGVSGGARISQADPVWHQSAIAQPWITGPIYTVGSGYLVVRGNRVNEMAEGVSKGNGDVSLKYPFMPSMGNLSMHSEHSLMDSVWQFHTMGYGVNDQRRAKGWWELEDSPDWASQKQIFLTADGLLSGNRQRELMRPLDRDLDLYSGGYQFDFYARQSPGCEPDPQRVHDDIVGPGGLVDRIKGNKSMQIAGVCERMARSYIRMFQDELTILQATAGASQSRIAQLQQWIMELNTFIAKLT